MIKVVCEPRMCRVVVMLALAFVTVSGGGVPAAARVDDDSAAGSDVFGATAGGDGSPLPGVLISLSGDGVNLKTVSESDGSFRFTSIQPGDYSVVFKMTGLKKAKQKIVVATEDLDLGTITLE